MFDKILPILLLLALWQPLQAQKEVRQADVLHLQDGSQLKGFIVQEYDNGDIQFDLFGDDVINIKAEQIKSKQQGGDNKLYYPDGRSYSVKGYYSTLRISSSWGSDSNTEEGSFSGMHLHNVHGYQLMPQLGIGGGIGLDILSGPSNNTYTFLPVYAEVRVFPVRSKISPFLTASGGYSMSFDIFNNFVEAGEFYDGGLFGKVTAGVSFATKRKSQFFVDVGLFFLDSRSKFQDYLDGEIPVFVDEEIQFRRWEIGFGWLF
ncbi:MAG: hypothetical protein AAFV95_12075 [Bacteroidota bacterium]